ncbi:MAG: hypothetical protein JO057_06545 [Chloroflexi bacterium]|nr:hypothetical protein [Chloroflexota bacterium]
MAISVMAFPVAQDRLTDLRAMLDELNGSRHLRTAEVHQRAGVHERGYVQKLPNGQCLYLAVFDSVESESALARVMQANAADAEYGPWIFERLQHVFRMDPGQGIPPTAEFVYDSQVPVTQPNLGPSA